MKKLAMISMTALLAGCTAAPDLEQQIDELYQKMPQEERIAQLRSMYMDELFDEAGNLDTAKCRELIPYGIGHFSQFALQKPRDPISFCKSHRPGRVTQNRGRCRHRPLRVTFSWSNPG